MSNESKNIQRYCRRQEDPQDQRQAEESWYGLVRGTLADCVCRRIKEPSRVTPNADFQTRAAWHALTQMEPTEDDVVAAMQKAAMLKRGGDTMLWTTEEVDVAIRAAVRPRDRIIAIMSFVYFLFLIEISLVLVSVFVKRGLP